MARGQTTEDITILQMALIGFEIEKKRIEEKILDLQSKVKGRSVHPVAAAAPKPAGGKRNLSAAARKRIADAQKKRWAEHRRRKAQAAREA